MSLNARKLLVLLELADWESRELRSETLKTLQCGDDLSALLARKCNRSPGKRNCPACDTEGYCAFLRGTAQASLGNFEEAARELEFANRRFRSVNQIWNHIVGLSLLGLMHERSGKRREALLEYKKALASLNKIYLTINQNEYRNIRKALALRQALADQAEALFRSP